MNYKFSIITPEHKKENIPFLMELYETIKSQTYTNWEWVLYLNGNCKISHLPQELKDDDRVKIHNGITHDNVGFVKNKAFNLGRGDILVEVDHDDLLTDDCLEELNDAFQDDEIGFVYSEDLLYDMRGDEYKIPWNPNNGWTYEWVEFRGEKFIKIDSFPHSSHTVGIIWYAPDHVRAWRKNVYKKIGGHNPDLNICDDHELMIRTYLETKYHFIPKILYYYRWLPGGDNTQLQRTDSIQVKTFELFHQYGKQLAERDADLMDLLKVNIFDYQEKPGYVNFDIKEFNKTGKLPFEDNSVFVIDATHVLQKAHDKIKLMSEIYRVLYDRGWTFIEVPSTDGRGAFQDPTHVSYWNENSFWYYTRRDYANYINNTDIKFQEFRLDTVWWENNIAVTNAWLCSIKSNGKKNHPIYI